MTTDPYERQKKWRRANAEKYKDCIKRSKQKRIASMSPEELVEYRRKVNQNKKFSASVRKGITTKPDICEVCGGSGTICVDHDHQTQLFRGWLCEGCNTALGRVKDNPDTLRKLANYLERHGRP